MEAPEPLRCGRAARRHLLLRRRAAEGAFIDPYSLPTLVLLDGDKGVTTNSTSGTPRISEWICQATGTAFAQPSDGSRFDRVSVGLGGNAGARGLFSPFNCRHVIVDGTSFGDVSSSTWFWVFDQAAVTTTNCLVAVNPLGRQISSAGSGGGIEFNDGGGSVQRYGGGVIEGPQVVALVFDAPGLTSYARRNGAALGTPQPYTGGFDVRDVQFAVGGRVQGASKSQPLQGDLYFLVAVAGVLDAATIAGVEAYFALRYELDLAA